MAADRPNVGTIAEGSAAGDLARLRAIAEEGRARPLLGGASLIAWGGAIALASLLNWAVLTRTLALPGWSISLAWFGLMSAAGVISWIGKRGDAGASAVSTANRTSRAVWRMVGAFLGTMAVGLTLHAAFGGPAGASGAARWAMLSVMAPVTFGAFGIALAATAISGNSAWLLRYSWVSLGLTIVTAALLGQAVQSLVMAAGAIAVGVLPGIRMIKAASDG